MSNAVASARRSIQKMPKRGIVRDDLAGTDAVDILGRQGNSDDLELLPSAVDDRSDRVRPAPGRARGRTTRSRGPRRRDWRRRSVRPGRTGRSASPGVGTAPRSVARSPAPPGPAHRARRPRPTRVSSCATPGIWAIRSRSREGARLRLAKHVGEPVALVVGALRGAQRIERTQIHHIHRDAGCDDHRDGERLSLDRPEIAQQFPGQRTHIDLTIGDPAETSCARSSAAR